MISYKFWIGAVFKRLVEELSEEIKGSKQQQQEKKQVFGDKTQ